MTSLSTGFPRAHQYGMTTCLGCHKLVKMPALQIPSDNNGSKQRAVCPRCSAPLNYRKPGSFNKTLAYTITAFVLLIPANVLPVMTVIYLGKGSSDTIMSGVMHLLHAGMVPIALLVFIASIFVPLMKLLGIVLLLSAVKFDWHLSAQQCTRMYHFVEIIGKWSMLDLFMISILVTLVDLGGIATITAGNGATAFAGVVVMTILAAGSFDTRLIWDLQNNAQNSTGQDFKGKDCKGQD